MRRETPAGNRGSAKELIENDAKSVARGSALPIVTGDIPRELQNLPRWTGYQFGLRENGRLAKIPTTESGFPCDSTSSANWLPFDRAYANWTTAPRESNGGIGIQLPNDHIVIDCDDTRDPVTGELKQWAHELVKMFDSYTEVSVSGCGIHIWVRGDWKGIDEWSGIEVKRGSFVAVTGLRLPDVPRTIERRQKELDALERSERHMVSARFVRDRRFRQLYKGSVTPSRYRSREHADDAFVLSLFWLLREREAVERALRRSGRYRTRWDRPVEGQTYFDLLLDTAQALYLEASREQHLADLRDPVRWLQRAGKRVTKTRRIVLEAMTGCDAPIWPAVLAHMTGLTADAVKACLAGLRDIGVVDQSSEGWQLPLRPPTLIASSRHSYPHSDNSVVIALERHRQRRDVEAEAQHAESQIIERMSE